MAGKLHSKKPTEMETGHIFELYALAKDVLFGNRHPDRLTLMYTLGSIRWLGLWPRRRQDESWNYYIFSRMILVLLSIFVATQMLTLSEAVGDIVQLGDQLVLLVGLSLILLKITVFRTRRYEIEAILLELNEMHQKFCFSTSEEDAKILRVQRLFFLFDFLSVELYKPLGICLAAAIAVQPFFVDQSLPFRAIFPFGLHDPSQHPYGYIGVYIFQCICCLHSVLSVIYLDSIVGHSFAEMAANLKILALVIRRLRPKENEASGAQLEFEMWNNLREVVQCHQQIIRLIEQMNSCLYLNYVGQMTASTFMICLTAFEAMLAKDQPMVAFKFGLYMLAAFTQLFYWCWLGNMVYYDSLEIATAAFELREWYVLSPSLQRNLMFLIKRAQKPLVFRPSPLVPFTFETFTAILSTSYSYFALLRTMHD